MKELKQLSEYELAILHREAIDFRNKGLALVQEYGFDVGQLVSQTFERDIESEYGRKTLKRLENET